MSYADARARLPHPPTAHPINAHIPVRCRSSTHTPLAEYLRPNTHPIIATCHISRALSLPLTDYPAHHATCAIPSKHCSCARPGTNVGYIRGQVGYDTTKGLVMSDARRKPHPNARATCRTNGAHSLRLFSYELLAPPAGRSGIPLVAYKRYQSTLLVQPPHYLPSSQ